MSKLSHAKAGHRFDRLAFALGAVALGLLVSALSVQAFCWVFPAEPSAAVLRLQNEAGQRPLQFDNGRRLAGLLAPQGVDPLDVGRCLFPDAEERERAALAGDLAEYSPRAEPLLMEKCLNGQPPLAQPAAVADAKAAPSWTLENWLVLGRETPDPTLLARAQTVWNGGDRRLGTVFFSPSADQRPLSMLDQWRMASAVVKWHNGSRNEALEIWSASGQDAMRSAESDLIASMASTTTLSRLLLSLQAAVRSSAALNAAEANRAIQIASAAEGLPPAIHQSMIGEWQMMEATFRTVALSAAHSETPGESTQQTRVMDWTPVFMGFVYDPMDTVNQFTERFETNRSAVLAAANGQAAPAVEPDRPCAWMGAYWHVCRLYERNPLGRYLVRSEPADYTSYGTRIADLRNLAAATRLTIEARRRGLTGEALARFIASAPEGMRDVFTQQAFAYHPETRRLGVVLRENSHVLGKPGTYELGL